MGAADAVRECVQTSGGTRIRIAISVSRWMIERSVGERNQVLKLITITPGSVLEER